MRLRLATCLDLPEPDPDRAPLDDALARAGIAAAWVAWDDPSADWDAPVPTIVRTTWNYAQNRSAFLAWAERAHRAAPVFNPPDVLRDNTHKRYLLDLAARGVPTVPTRFVVARGTTERVAALGWRRVVVKPAVGAGSDGVRAFDGSDPAADVHVAQLAARGDVLVQPYLDSVDDHGERSLVWIGGELTHAVRKTTRFAGQDERITGPFPVEDDERRVALAALAPWIDRILYGRVDVARDASGAPVVMELELAEPSLFFALGRGSASRFVESVLRRLDDR